MKTVRLSEKAETYLRKLCLEIPGRQVGSKGNLDATDFFATIMETFGFETEKHGFECMDWNQEGAWLFAGDNAFQVFASPYSPGCNISAPLAVASTVDEMAALEAANQILLLHGEIAGHQLMPKNFPFYNPDEHKRIIQLLEAAQPTAIVAATSRNPEMVGAMYPFPLIEDGDFDIPSVYMTDEAGDKLAEHVGKMVWLKSCAERTPAVGYNVIARKGTDRRRRVVLFAHIDAKLGTPGAIDNASGVVVLLLLAELFKDYEGDLGIEMVAMNGEDYYSNPGEQQYLALNADRFDEIGLGINIDGVGYRKGNVAYSLYDCPPEMASSIRNVFSTYGGIVEDQPWYQGDHVLFLLNQRPALAITSECVTELMAEIIHTSEDRPEMVDTHKLANVAAALHEILLHLNQTVA